MVSDFHLWISIILATFVEKTILSLLKWLQILLILFHLSIQLFIKLYSYPYTNVLIIVALQLSFEMGKCDSSKFFILFQDCFDYFGSLVFTYQFQDQLLISGGKKASRNYNKDHTESIDQLGEYFYLNNFVFCCMNMECLSIYLALL